MRNTLSRLLFLSAIVCFALSSAPARAADAVVWDFTQLPKDTLIADQKYPYKATDGSTTMTYQASSGDVIVERNGGNYLKLNGASKSDGRRCFVLAVTGKGKIKIETYSNTGKWIIYDGSQSGPVLAGAYSGFNTGSKQETETAEIEASTSLYFYTTEKGYIRRITWTPSGESCPTPAVAITSGFDENDTRTTYCANDTAAFSKWTGWTATITVKGMGE